MLSNALCMRFWIASAIGFSADSVILSTILFTRPFTNPPMPPSPLLATFGSLPVTPSLIHFGMSFVNVSTTDLHSDVKPSESVLPGLAP